MKDVNLGVLAAAHDEGLVRAAEARADDVAPHLSGEGAILDDWRGWKRGCGSAHGGREVPQVNLLRGEVDEEVPGVVGDGEGRDGVRLCDAVLAPLIKVEEADLLLGAHRHHPTSVFGDTEVVDAGAVPAVELLAVEVPHKDVLVQAARDYALTVWHPRGSRHLVRVLSEHVEASPRRHLPESNGSIAAAREQMLVARGPREKGEGVLVAGEGEQARASGGHPHLDRLVEGA
mmetsp:Transcript_11179/g.36800  ORF Transcript_11179/g.36800 Transcript_11179/m.36800 type:complete len:232 (-) Transcript_11179:1623-2318(-)